MAKLEHFLTDLQEQFRDLDSVLVRILKEEQSIRDEVLWKKGFIIHQYSLKYNAMTIEALSNILQELQAVLKKEVQLQQELANHADELQKIAQDYEAMTKKKLPSELLASFLKEALYYSNIMVTRVNYHEFRLRAQLVAS